MGKTEVRFEIDVDELSVIDGYCSATDKCRTEIIKTILNEWSEKKLHESILVCRVAGVNPTVPEANRSTEEHK